MKDSVNTLILKSIGIDTYRENIVYMHANCHICLSEGFTALTRVVVEFNNRHIVATLNVVHSDLLAPNEAGLSMEAQGRLNAHDGDILTISHLKTIESLALVRSKMYGSELTEAGFRDIITDVVEGHYSNIELAAFISACSSDNLSVKEITGLTKAMVHTGEILTWNEKMIFDKHCIGGLPGNRTSPIVISIAAAAGLTIPKTSSRAITSPAGTADMMATITKVDLNIARMKEVVAEQNACLAWGGAVHLSPADDILISVEKALDVDSPGQMIASVLSKKVAAGATHVVIDIPVGPTAKVRSQEDALELAYYFKAVSGDLGIVTETVITDGSQPVGSGIGPALEAMDVLAVLRNEPGAPADLRDRSLKLAGILLEMSGRCEQGKGAGKAAAILSSGEAFEKFYKICMAQGGFTEPAMAHYRYDVLSSEEGVVQNINNRLLARIAKLAGAPDTPSAGIRFHAPLGKKISRGDLLFTIFSGFAGQLEYAKDYLEGLNGLIELR